MRNHSPPSPEAWQPHVSGHGRAIPAVLLAEHPFQRLLFRPDREHAPHPVDRGQHQRGAGAARDRRTEQHQPHVINWGLRLYAYGPVVISRSVLMPQLRRSE